MGELLPMPVLEGLLENWAVGDGPLYRRMADRFRVAIDSGRLAPGTMLPPERQLADTLSVSRSTVVAAFEDLKSSRHLDARQGSGTWVRGRTRPADEGNRELVEQLDEHAIVRDLSGAPTETIEFTAAAVDCAPEVTDTLAALTPEQLTTWAAGHGYSPQGSEALREVVAERLTVIGLSTSASEVLITGGATQALLLAARLYLEPGAPAVLETPSYAGAIDVLHAAGARLLSVDRDASGARTDQLADVVARSLPRLVYLVPDFHNPTGGVLSARRREEVAQLAGDFHVPVVEDIVQRELWFDQPPPPPIASYAPGAPVLTVGSMSKVFWGGLRLGWIRGPRDVIARLARMKAVTDFGVPMFTQLLSAQLLPLIDQTASWRRRDLIGRLDCLTEAMEKHLPDWRFERPAGGLSVWAKLPSPTADELVRRAVNHGVSIVPGSTFAVDHRRHTDRIRLPFVAPPDVIEEGVRRLAEAWDGIDHSGGRRPAPAVVI